MLRYAPKMLILMTLSAILTLTLWSNSWGQHQVDLPDGSKLDLSKPCPVCGMIVGGDLEGTASYSYANGQLVVFGGAAAAVFPDGTVVGFEGARCLFIYNTVPKRFGIDVSKIVNRYVTEFGTKKMIDANGAFLVMGSKIKGPMGHELIAFSTREEAEKFRAEYGGKRIVQLGTVGAGDVERREQPSRGKTPHGTSK